MLNSSVSQTSKVLSRGHKLLRIPPTANVPLPLSCLAGRLLFKLGDPDPNLISLVKPFLITHLEFIIPSLGFQLLYIYIYISITTHMPCCFFYHVSLLHHALTNSRLLFPYVTSVTSKHGGIEQPPEFMLNGGINGVGIGMQKMHEL